MTDQSIQRSSLGAVLHISQMDEQSYARSLEVNQQYVEMTAPMDLAELREIVSVSCYAKQAGAGEAFLVAVKGDIAYDCENHEWFKARYNDFIYIDRIVIGDGLQRKGLGRIFYEDLMNFAKTQNIDYLCAEVNVKPDNPPSHMFHKTMGFEAVGEGHIGEKIVQYYVKKISN